MVVDEEEDLICPGCLSGLSEPYIKCVLCKPESVFICLHCFAKGFETTTHHSNHAFEIIKNDFPLFEDSWTAAEESNLVKAVGDCGLGNWSDISTQLGSKSKDECRWHYMNCYIERPCGPLPVLPDPGFQPNPPPIVYKLSDDPPRPLETSSVCLDMAGYAAARSEFTVEHDNYMELDLCHLEIAEEEDEDWEVDMKLAALRIYQSCLRERQRRKRIVRKYGLINLRKVNAVERRYERTLKPFMDCLRAVMRLISPHEHDCYLEALHYEQELKSNIASLQDFRANGLTLLRHVKVYEQLKSRRDIERTKRHMLNDILGHIQDETACQSWLQRQALLGKLPKGFQAPLPTVPRKSAPPLDIMGLPGYERLDDHEKELCASVRLVPDAYLEFKSLLLTEYNKVGSLKLAQARNLIKIDVNKTRRLYDFLISQGLIKRECS